MCACILLILHTIRPHISSFLVVKSAEERSHFPCSLRGQAPRCVVFGFQLSSACECSRLLLFLCFLFVFFNRVVGVIVCLVGCLRQYLLSLSLSLTLSFFLSLSLYLSIQPHSISQVRPRESDHITPQRTCEFLLWVECNRQSETVTLSGSQTQ